MPRVSPGDLADADQATSSGGGTHQEDRAWEPAGEDLGETPAYERPAVNDTQTTRNIAAPQRINMAEGFITADEAPGTDISDLPAAPPYDENASEGEADYVLYIPPPDEEDDDLGDLPDYTVVSVQPHIEGPAAVVNSNNIVNQMRNLNPRQRHALDVLMEDPRVPGDFNPKGIVRANRKAIARARRLVNQWHVSPRMLIFVVLLPVLILIIPMMLLHRRWRRNYLAEALGDNAEANVYIWGSKGYATVNGDQVRELSLIGLNCAVARVTSAVFFDESSCVVASDLEQPVLSVAQPLGLNKECYRHTPCSNNQLDQHLHEETQLWFLSRKQLHFLPQRIVRDTMQPNGRTAGGNGAILSHMLGDDIDETFPLIPSRGESAHGSHGGLSVSAHGSHGGLSVSQGLGQAVVSHRHPQGPGRRGSSNMSNNESMSSQHNIPVSPRHSLSQQLPVSPRHSAGQPGSSHGSSSTWYRT